MASARSTCASAMWRRVSAFARALRPALALALVLTAGALGLGLQNATAQVLTPGVTVERETGPEPPPEELSPETIDGYLARLTDSDIRTLLRDELVRRADAEAAAAADDDAPMLSVRERLAELLTRIQQRVARWWAAIANLDERADQVADRMALADGGVWGIARGALALVAAGLAAAGLVIWLTSGWRAWLRDTDGAVYGERVVRSVALAAVQMLPIVAFSIAIWAVTPAFSGLLGPLHGGGLSYVWIFQTGVAYGWMIIVLSQRVNAPDAPQLRLAESDQSAVADIHGMTRIGAMVGIGGWLLAGLFPSLGYGFAPAMLIVAASGTVLMAIILVGLGRNFEAIRQGLGGLRTEREGASSAVRRRSSLGEIIGRAAPWAVVIYLFAAYLYWLARWLETGTLYIIGPLGTMLVWLLSPAITRMGDELIDAALPHTETAQRFYRVLCGAWRVALAGVAIVVIGRLWDVDVFAFFKGQNASVWAGAVFDIGVTILFGQLIWRLIQAALYTEKRIAGADEDQALDAPSSTRLDTLIPLFRNLLLMVLAVVVIMITLSSLGVDIGPLLASAGIIGIAIGFGAQTLVRDIFSGAFFLIDDAFRVGEYIELEGDLRGEVEAISIRSLQLRHHRGAVITIPFGELRNVTNHSRDWVIYKMTFRLEPDSDPAVVKKIVKRVGFELLEDPEHASKFLEPLKSQGVLMIDDDSALIIRVKFKSKPRTQFVLRREVYHRLRAAFAEAGIRFARRKVEVVSSGGETPADLAAQASAAEETPKSPSQAATTDMR